MYHYMGFQFMTNFWVDHLHSHYMYLICSIFTINLSISPFCQHFCCLPVNYPFSHYSISNMTYLLSSIVYINVSLLDQANTCWQMINRIIVWTCLNITHNEPTQWTFLVFLTKISLTIYQKGSWMFSFWKTMFQLITYSCL